MESLKKIEYTKKGKLNLTTDNASAQAIADIGPVNYNGYVCGQCRTIS